MSLQDQSSPVTKITSKAVFFWSLAAFFFGYEFLLRVSPNVMQAELKSFFKIDATYLGILSSSFYYGYALFQIPSGLLIDRYGARIFLAVGAILCGGGGMIMALVDVYWFAWIGRFWIGAGSAFALVGTLKISSEWFPLDRYGLLTGLTLTIGVVGALGGAAPLAWGVDTMGWQSTLFYTGLVGIILAVVIYIFIRDRDETLIVDVAGQKDWREVLVVLKNPHSWMTGLFGGAMYIPVTVFGELWGTPFLMEQWGCTKAKAAGFLSIIFIGMALGSPACGWFSDIIHRRKAVALGSCVVATILSLVLIFMPLKNEFWTAALLCVLGFSLGAQILIFPIIRELNPSHVNAFTVGFCNTLAMGFASSAQPLVGYVLDFLQGSSRMVEGIGAAAYSLENLRMSLLVVPVMLAIASFMMMRVKETYGQPMEEREGK